MNVRTRNFVVALAVVVAIAGVALFSFGGPAFGHVHQICTPGAGDPTISQEPYHGGIPGHSGDTRQDLDTNPNFGSRGFHPIHESLHMTNATQRSITVVVVPGQCP